MWNCKSTGYGAHGDYLFGWEDGALQRAMDALGTNCWSETCPALKLQSGEKLIGCTKAQQAKEDVDACKFFVVWIVREDWRLTHGRAPDASWKPRDEVVDSRN